jgi:RNA polymerase sigma-70 factor (ECF subfamily)
MRRGAGGDEDELDRWMAQWYVPAYRSACLVLGNASDAEEAVQEAFLRMWRFRASMPSGDAARPWLFRVVMNSCYSLARNEQRAKRRRDYGASEDDVADSARRPDDLAVAEVSSLAVREALARLPEHLRIPVVLRYYAGLSDKEIALAIHRRSGTVKSRLHEARRMLGADLSLQHLARANEDSK